MVLLRVAETAESPRLESEDVGWVGVSISAAAAMLRPLRASAYNFLKSILIEIEMQGKEPKLN